MIAYQILSSLLNFLVAGVLGLAVVLRGRTRGLNLRFGLFAFGIAAWSAAYYLWQLSTEAATALFFTRVLMIFAYFLPIVFYHFVGELCGEPIRRSVRAGYLVAALFSVLNFTSLMVPGVEPAMSFAFWPRAGPLYWLYIVLFISYTGQACRILLRNMREASGARAVQLRNILLATVVGFGGGATNFPLWYGVPLPPLGNILIFIYLLIMAHAVSSYRLPLVAHDFFRASVYLGLSATLSVVYLILYVLVCLGLGYEPEPAALFTQFIAAVAVCWFFLWAVPRLHRLADILMIQTYYRGRHARHEHLRRFGARIGSIGSEQRMFEELAETMGRAFHLKGIRIYIRCEFDRDFSLRASWGEVDGPQAIPMDTVPVEALRKAGGPFLTDGAETLLSAEDQASAESFANTINAAVISLVESDEFLAGLFVFDPRTDQQRFTQTELSLIGSLGLQLAVTLRVRQLERRASQTDKLIALGTMAAGLAHELRNPLTSVQTLSAMLAESRPDIAALEEFGPVVRRDVARIAGIVDNISAFAESNRVEKTSVDLVDVVRTVVEIVTPGANQQGVELRVSASGDTMIEGNHSQLVQVFMNLVQNALQALVGRADARVHIIIGRLASELTEPRLLVRVVDNGPGIDAGILPRVFDPFTTTKATGARSGRHGMGLGLAIVKRIVQHHGGDIRVESKLGEGAVFYVYFPLLIKP